jgi:hypothetical protein
MFYLVWSKSFFWEFLVQLFYAWFSFCSSTVFFSKLYAERTLQVLHSETCIMLTFAFIENCIVYANKWIMLIFAFRSYSVSCFKIACSFMFLKILSWESMMCAQFSFSPKCLKFSELQGLYKEQSGCVLVHGLKCNLKETTLKHERDTNVYSSWFSATQILYKIYILCTCVSQE